MKAEVAKREIESLDYYLQNHTNDYSEESHTAMMMAIQALEQEPCDKCVYSTSEGCQYDDITETIPPFDKTRWIPVSERLPEKYSYTLWCASSGCVRSDYFDGEFWEDAKRYCYEVIAWMPLPEPYKAEGSEE